MRNLGRELLDSGALPVEPGGEAPSGFDAFEKFFREDRCEGIF